MIGVSPILKAHMQQELHQMIVEVLWRNPTLKYYQVRTKEGKKTGEGG